MKIAHMKIERFRTIKSAQLYFSGHTLLIGKNNVGKSTICEALDLVLGPDRISRFPPVQEFDFYNAEYLQEDGETPIPARIEVVLIDLTDALEKECPTHLEFWHTHEQRLLAEGELGNTEDPDVTPCLRLVTIAQYNHEEDEFEADTFFCHGTKNIDESPEKVGKRLKRLFGFLYLRTLRTGSRALSLERGSLLDIILRMQSIRTGLWEKSIKKLRDLDPPIYEEAPEIAPVLENIEKRLQQYIPIEPKGRATTLFVSQLTREHLRKTISFFLSLSPDQEPVPFREAGTGTLNTLVLALLSFIADVKPNNVIFAMEEPEIALPPHTQRRVARYLLGDTTQCFVTSHSPYIIEQFAPDQIAILRRDAAAIVTATAVSSVSSSLKSKTYKKHARRGLAEAMLGSAVIVAEGITERDTIRAVADQLEDNDDANYPLDLSGVSIFTADGDGSVANFGEIFKALGLHTYALYDKKKRKPEEDARLAAAFDHPCETPYKGMEDLLVTEVPLDRQWQLLEELRDNAEQTGIPAARPDDNTTRTLMGSALKSNKGNGYAERLLNLCSVAHLPKTISDFLKRVYADFPRPAPVPPPAAPAQPAPAE